MKPLDRDELFHNLRGFLKTKGIELQEGSYSSGIRKSCSLLSDAINLGQEGLGRAKTGIDRKLDQMRQVIHEKTAPAKPSTKTPSAAAPKPAAPPPIKAVTPKRRPRRKSKSAK